MRTAVISDVHGNIHAFEKIASDIKKRSVDNIFFLGDIAFSGLYPNECFELLTSLNPEIFIKGNTDSNFEEAESFIPSSGFEMKLKELILFGYHRLSPEALDQMKNWQIRMDFNVAGVKGICCHGSPYSFKDSLTRKNISNFKERIENEEAAFIFCGHTHSQTDFISGKTRIINFGAAGYSFDGNTDAAYGIFDSSDKIVFENIRVKYSREKYIREVRESNLPLKDNLIHALEKGRPLPFS